MNELFTAITRTHTRKHLSFEYYNIQCAQLTKCVAIHLTLFSIFSANDDLSCYTSVLSVGFSRVSHPQKILRKNIIVYFMFNHELYVLFCDMLKHLYLNILFILL